MKLSHVPFAMVLGKSKPKKKRRTIMISLSAAVSVIITLIVAGLIFWLLWWLIGYCGIPEPFNKVARVILAILAVIVIIGILLSLVNGQPLFRP